jgi:transposase
MLTRMTDEDWDLVVDIFQKVRSKRGAKGKDDRRFLEALHYFTLHNITWRALPAEFGNWNSVWRRFSRLSDAGTFEAFFQALAACSRSAGLIQMFDSTSIRAHVSAAGAKGGRKIRRWDGPAAGSGRKSTSSATSKAIRSTSTSPRTRRVTRSSSKSSSTAIRTLPLGA